MLPRFARPYDRTVLSRYPGGHDWVSIRISKDLVSIADSLKQ